MDVFFKNILDYLLNYVSRYSYFINGDYYGSLFTKYFSFSGFIIGFIFVLIVYFSSAEKQNKAGFFKVLPIIAVINSCVVLSYILDTTFNQSFNYSGIELMFNAPDNIISGFILTLVLCSCYRKFGRQAFLFGIATHGALLFLNFAYIENMGEIVIVKIIIRIVLAGFLCLIISYRKYFYTSWIWYFSFHIFLRLTIFFMPLLRNYISDVPLFDATYTLGSILEYLSHFIMDAIIFVIILAFAIVFEKGVLTVEPIKKQEQPE